MSELVLLGCSGWNYGQISQSQSDQAPDQSQSDQAHSQHSGLKCLGKAFLGSVIGGASPLGPLGSGLAAGAGCALNNR